MQAFFVKCQAFFAKWGPKLGIGLIVVCVLIAAVSLLWPTGQSAPPPAESPPAASPPAANPPTPSGTPGAGQPAPATPSATSVATTSVASPEGDILELFREVRGYKVAGKTGVDYEGRGVPFEVEIDATLLPSDDLVALTSNVEKQINLPADKKRKVTKVKYVRLTLSKDAKRFQSALVAFEGQQNGVDMHQAGKSVGVTIPMSPIFLDDSGSQTFAARLRAELKGRFGNVYLGNPLFPDDFPTISGPSVFPLDH